jgi:dipeptidyl aminopeptidase/acylaminoacyl peptidase
MKTVAFAILALTTCAASMGLAPESTPSLFQGLDLFDLQCVTDPQIRPDGRVIAYVRVSYDIWTDRAERRIWLVNVTTGAQTPVGTGPGDSPRWSADGKRLAYVASAEDGHSQIFVSWPESGQSARITDLTDVPRDLEWSADGHHIAFTMHTAGDDPHLGTAPRRPDGASWAAPLTIITDVVYRSDGEGYRKPGFSHVFVVSAEGGSARQVTFGPFDERGPLAWGADGQHLLLSGNRIEDWQRQPVNSQIYEISLADALIKPLTHRTVGPDTIPRASPDGKKIAYLGFDDRLLGYQNVHVYVMDCDGANPHSITDRLDRSVSDLRWAADSRSLYVQYTDEAITRVARLRLDGTLQPIAAGLAGPMIDRPYTIGESFTVSANGVVAFSSGGPDHPPELSVTRAGHTTQLTQLNEWLAHRKLGKMQRLAVKSSVDQQSVDAWLVLPAQFEPGKKYPLILEIHGGPYVSYGPLFSTDHQLYAAGGFAVLFANPRGSTSYGESFANSIQHDYPSHDYDDLMSAVDAAIATGMVSRDELFVTGGSGGGVLTAWIVGRTHRFRAAAAQKAVINWGSFALTGDLPTYALRYWFAKPVWEDPQSYWKHSPLSLVGNVTTPTLVVVGSEDFRTPVSESEQLYQALQLRGVPTAFVKVPGASHGGLAARPSQSAARASAILAWFDRYGADADGSRAATTSPPAATAN